MACPGGAAGSVDAMMPLHAGPSRVFSVKHEAGYPRLWRLLCDTAAEDARCRAVGASASSGTSSRRTQRT
eukprot:8414417-Lingulodinium_polyedra.AAC.1